MDSNPSFYPFKVNIAKTKWSRTISLPFPPKDSKYPIKKIKLQQTSHGVYVAQANIHPELESQFQ